MKSSYEDSLITKEMVMRRYFVTKEKGNLNQEEDEGRGMCMRE